MMADRSKHKKELEEDKTLEMEKLLETEKLISDHNQLKKDLKKRLRTIAEKSRNLVFEIVKKDRQNALVQSIGRGFTAAGSGISFLGAVLIPFVPPVGFGLGAFGAGVSVVGYLILGANAIYQIKSKKGKHKLAKQEFDRFEEEMKLMIEEYDQSATSILEDISTYPEI